MIHSVRIGSKARGRENESTSVCVFCILLGYAIKTVETTSGTVYTFLYDVYYIKLTFYFAH